MPKIISLAPVLYYFFIQLYALGIRLAGLFNPKAALWIKGRKRIFEQLAARLDAMPANAAAKRVWMHCASLGEFEQGRPILESIKKEYPNSVIFLSFFSPSGYEQIKNNPIANMVFYLPMDGPHNSKRLLHLLRPDLVVWVKYEFWYYYLTSIGARQIPLLMIAGLVPPNHILFSRIGGLWQKMAQSFTWFFTQNQESADLLKQYGITNRVSLGGDSRFDRVLAIANNMDSLPYIEKFCGQEKVLVAGSTWPSDEVVLSHYFKSNTDIKLIIAPHEVHASDLARIRELFKHAVFYSELHEHNQEQWLSSRVLVIDNIGMLSKLYRYATLAYIGGGFNRGGIHNVLEAAVYGCPVVFGPVYEKFTEATALVKSGGGVSIKNKEEAVSVFNDFFWNPSRLQTSGDAAKKMVKDNGGATQITMNYIRENRLLMR